MLHIKANQNKKSKNHKKRSKKEITIDDTKEIFNKNYVVSHIHKLSKKDASWKSEILKRTTNVKTMFDLLCSPLLLAIGMSYLSLPLIDLNNTKDNLLASEI